MVSTMLKVCILGIGNAGNQVAELAKKERNIPGLAINSSNKDLTNICNVDQFIIGDERGAGKDRNEAKNFMRQNIKNMLNQEQFKKQIEENEIIFIVSSTGGGTGSGMAPVMTEILSKMYPDKRFIIIQIFPPISESVAAQQNTIDYLKEIRQFMPNAVYMSYDNHRRANKPTDEMMIEVNREIVEDICIIRGDYNYPTPYSSIDEKDMMKMLETPGRLAIARVYGLKEKDLDEKSIEDHLLINLKTVSVAAELERDRIVKRMGVITNLGEKLHKVFDTKLTVFKEFVGEPVEGFEHIHINKEDTDPNRVVVILAGLSIPDDRIQKMIQRIDEAKEALNRTKPSSILDNVQTEDIDALREIESRENVAKDIDLNDIFSKYKK